MGVRMQRHKPTTGWTERLIDGLSFPRKFASCGMYLILALRFTVSHLRSTAQASEVKSIHNRTLVHAKPQESTISGYKASTSTCKNACYSSAPDGVSHWMLRLALIFALMKFSQARSIDTPSKHPSVASSSKASARKATNVSGLSIPL
jgi:hypothetical protein